MDLCLVWQLAARNWQLSGDGCTRAVSSALAYDNYFLHRRQSTRSTKAVYGRAV